MVKICYIPNLMDNTNRKEWEFEYCRDTTIRQYVLQAGFDPKDLRVIVSGKVTDILDIPLKDGDEVIVTSNIGFEIIIAGLAVLGGGSILWGVVKAAIIVGVIAYGVYSMMSKPRKPTFDTMATGGGGLDENSPTYGWDGIATTQQVGLSVPVIYGEHKVGGNIINSYVSYAGDDNRLHLLLGLAEGEIYSVSDIKINENPIANYSNVTYAIRYGLNTQTIIPGFEDTHNVYNVGVNLPQNVPYTYTTIDNDVEAIELLLTCPSGLFSVTNEGGMSSASVTYNIQYKLHSEMAYINLGDTTFSAANRSSVRRTYKIAGLAAGQYDIKVVKTSSDSSTMVICDLTWASVDEIKTDDIAYNNTALLSIDALASNQISGSTPNITCIVKGKKVLVPLVMDGTDIVAWDDYYWDPATEEYKLFSDDSVVTWDGLTYHLQYSANPIWCMRDLLTNTRYGLGEFISTTDLSLDQYVEMSQYCEEKLPDGNGSFEKRYRMDVVIEGSGSAPDVIAQLTTVFNGFPFYSGGKINLKLDRAETPAQMFGMGNIVKDSFSLSWMSKRDLPNLINLQYLSKDKDYQQEQIGYADEVALIAGEPLRKREIRTFTTSTSQAIRQARYALNVAKHIDKSVTFKAGIDGIACQAGSVISLSHDVLGVGESGRVLAGSTVTSVKLDKSVTLLPASTYKLRIRFSDDTIEEKTVSTGSGTVDTVEVVGDPFSQAPAAYGIWMFGVSNLVKEDYRIIRFGKNERFEVEITALKYDASVYDDTDVDLPDDNTTPPSYAIPNVSNLVLSERIYTLGSGSVESAIDVYFVKPQWTSYGGDNRYRGANVYLRVNGTTDWELQGYTESDKFSIMGNIIVGTTYDVLVASVSVAGEEADKATSPYDDITIAGVTDGPPDVSNFAADFTDQLILTWNKINQADIAGYEIRLVDNSWGTDSVDLVWRGKANSYTFRPTTRTPGTYYIKAMNTSLIFSDNAVNVTPTNVVPSTPTNFTSVVFFNLAKLTWDNVTDTDLIKYEVYRSETNAWTGEETLEGQVSGRSIMVDARKPTGGSVVSATGNTVVDTALIGLEDDFCVGDQIHITTGVDLDDKKTITDFDGVTGTITIDGTWTVNPVALDKFVVYDISYFKVRACDYYGGGLFTTSLQVIFETLTEDALGDAIITARKLIAGEVITLSAQIRDAIITNAHILDLAADKITAGTIGAEEIIMATGGSIRSENYVYGVSGYKLDATTGLEVWSGEIRGNTIILGTIDTTKFDSDTKNHLMGGVMCLHGTTAGFSSSKVRDLQVLQYNSIEGAGLKYRVVTAGTPTPDFEIGDVITGGTSLAEAVVMMPEGGNTYILRVTTGTFVVGETVISSGGGSSTLTTVTAQNWFYLPAGTYLCNASAIGGQNCWEHRASLYNHTLEVVTIYGTPGYHVDPSGGMVTNGYSTSPSVISGVFTVTELTEFYIYHYAYSHQGYFGHASGQGGAEPFVTVMLQKLGVD